MAVISSAQSGGRGNFASPPSPRSFFTSSPVAASLILHLGIAVVALWAAHSKEMASPSTGHPKAFQVEIVQLPSMHANRNTITTPTAPKPQPDKQKNNNTTQHLRANASPKVSPAAALPDADAHKIAVNQSTASTPASGIENAEAAPQTNGGSPAPSSSGHSNQSHSTDDAIPLLTDARYRVPPTQPRYPKRARDLNQEGEVLIRVRLSRSGSAEEVLVWKSSGHVLLDNSAQAAVRRWDFEPARRNGQPIIAWVQIPVRFSLH